MSTAILCTKGASQGTFSDVLTIGKSSGYRVDFLAAGVTGRADPASPSSATRFSDSPEERRRLQRSGIDLYVPYSQCNRSR